MHKALRGIRHLAGPFVYMVHIMQMYDQGVSARAPLEVEHTLNGSGVSRIGCQPVHRFGGYGDELALRKAAGAVSNVGGDEWHGNPNPEIPGGILLNECIKP